MRRLVSSSSRSSTRPSEYVLPEPDCPHRNVCRSKPRASIRAGTPAASISSPMSSAACFGALPACHCRTSSAVAARMGASWNAVPWSSSTPVPRATRIRCGAAPVPAVSTAAVTTSASGTDASSSESTWASRGPLPVSSTT